MRTHNISINYKVILLLFIFLYQFNFYSIVYSQNVIVSQPIEIRGDVFFEFFPSIENNTLIFREKNNKFYLNTYDSKLNNILEKEIIFPDKDIEVITTSYSPTNWYVVYQSTSHSKSFTKIMKLNTSGEITDTLTLKQEKYSISTESFKNTESKDKSKLLLFRHIEHKGMELISIDIPHLKIHNYGVINLDEFDVRMNFRSICISNEGMVFFLMYKSKSLISSGKAVLYCLGIDNQIKEKKMADEFDFDNIIMSYDNKNKIVAIAGFNNRKFNNKSQNYFILKFTNELSNVGFKINNYNPKVLTKYNNIRNSRNYNYLTNLNCKNLEFRNDGGVILVLEKKETIIRSNRMPMQPRYSAPVDEKEYIIGDVFIISMHENCDEFWTEYICKNQTSTDDEAMFSSFAMAMNNNAMKFIFNEDISSTTQVLNYSIDPLGKMQKSSLLNTGTYKIKMIMTESKQVSYNQVLIPSYDKNELRLVLITL